MLGFIGGTGPEGRGLAVRFALAGERVLIGSRDEARASKAAERVMAKAPSADVAGVPNEDAARMGDPVFVTVPYAAQHLLLQALRNDLDGKTVVCVVAPVAFYDGVARAIAVPDGSAALEAQAALPGSTVVAAFQTISGHDLLVPGRPIDSDVVVCADDEEARETVMRLAEKIAGVRAINGGGLQNAVYVESFTALLLNINRLYKARSAIRIAGI